MNILRWALPLLLAAVAVRAESNLVEPLSNGLSLSMTGPEIQKKFGPPTEKGFDARTFGYPGFSVNVGGRDLGIWHLTLKKGVTLACGVGVGSSRADVVRAFGSADGATSGPYKLAFSYSGDKVAKIRVDPASGSFSPAPAANPAAKAPAGADPLVGNWRGLAHTIATIELKADGTYSGANGGHGTWKREGGEVVFTGPLAAWNGGRARLSHLSRETLEFEWRDARGAKNYFALGKY